MFDLTKNSSQIIELRGFLSQIFSVSSRDVGIVNVLPCIYNRYRLTFRSLGRSQDSVDPFDSLEISSTIKRGNECESE